jgi:hypothetical protein
VTPEMWLQLGLGVCGAIAAGAGVYAAIKGDLAHTRALAEQAVNDANKAHDRIDNLLQARRG